MIVGTPGTEVFKIGIRRHITVATSTAVLAPSSLNEWAGLEILDRRKNVDASTEP